MANYFNIAVNSRKACGSLIALLVVALMLWNLMAGAGRVGRLLADGC